MSEDIHERTVLEEAMSYHQNSDSTGPLSPILDTFAYEFLAHLRKTIGLLHSDDVSVHPTQDVLSFYSDVLQNNQTGLLDFLQAYCTAGKEIDHLRDDIERALQMVIYLSSKK